MKSEPAGCWARTPVRRRLTAMELPLFPLQTVLFPGATIPLAATRKKPLGEIATFL